MDEQLKTKNYQPDPTPSKHIELPEPTDSQTISQVNISHYAEVNKGMSSFERDTFKLSIVAVILSAFAALFICLQWYEMYEGGIDTHKLAEAARNQATWTQGLADSAKRQSDNTLTLANRTKDLADQMKDQYHQIKIIAKQTQIQSQIATESLISVQRAFITVKRDLINTPNYSENGIQAWKIGISLENNGTTPAIRASQGWGYIVSPNILTEDFHLTPTNILSPHTFTIGPKEVLQEPEIASLPVEWLRQVQEHNMHLYIWYFISYNDVFSNTPRHVSMFCMHVNDVYGDVTQDKGIKRMVLFYTLTSAHNCTDDSCIKDPDDPRKREEQY